MGRIDGRKVKHLIIIMCFVFCGYTINGDQMYQWFSLWFRKMKNFEFWQVISHNV